ncbi:MAG: hypothetical protein AB8B84_03915 [Granulosicoccus sp.]
MDISEFEVPEFYQKTQWPPREYDPILREMGRLIFNWNSIENSTRNILDALIGAGQKSNILTAHMGTQSQLDALKTIANGFLNDDEKNHILHAISLYSRLREYRNYFVHSFSMLYGPTPMAGLSSLKAKGNLVKDELKLTEDEFVHISTVVRCAVHYFNLVLCHFRYKDNQLEEYRIYDELPSFFPIPPQLSKDRRSLIDP